MKNYQQSTFSEQDKVSAYLNVPPFFSLCLFQKYKFCYHNLKFQPQVLLLLSILFYISHLYINNIFPNNVSQFHRHHEQLFIYFKIYLCLDLLKVLSVWSLSLFLIQHVFSSPEVQFRFNFAYIEYFFSNFSSKCIQMTFFLFLYCKNIFIFPKYRNLIKCSCLQLVNVTVFEPSVEE